MAGLRAAPIAPTWPDINGKIIPDSLTELSPFSRNLDSNPIMVHFIHRGLAYLLFIMIMVWWFRSGGIKNNRFYSFLRISLIALVFLQVTLGILTVLNATQSNHLVVLGVSHQFTAMLITMVWLSLIFVVRRKPAR